MPAIFAVHTNPYASWKLPLSRTELQTVLAAMAHAAGLDDASGELAIIDDHAMEQLNQEAMSCTGPTNILSFPAETQASSLLGWMALSPDTLLRECLLYGQEPGEHCIRLLAHGFAHLMGHDHGPAMDALADVLEIAGQSALV